MLGVYDDREHDEPLAFYAVMSGEDEVCVSDDDFGLGSDYEGKGILLTDFIDQRLKKNTAKSPAQGAPKTDMRTHAKVLRKRGTLVDEDDDEGDAPLLYDSEEASGDEADDDGNGALSAVVRAATGRDLTSKRERRAAVTVERGVGEEDALSAPISRKRSGTDVMASMLAALEGAENVVSENVDELRRRVEKLSGDGHAPLDAPLPDAVAGRLERAAAYDKTKTELTDKWARVVQENRRARTLRFPLGAPDSATYPQTGNAVSTYKARSKFECEIEALLAEGGIEGERDVAKRENDDLKAAEVTKEEVIERRRELARMRSLAFEYERKMRRIKKIKSKRFRKIMKAEKARIEDELGEGGVENPVEERLKAEKRRAEERMTLRHKNTSKWVKRQLKRGEDKRNPNTRAAIEEQLRTHEQLRRRQEAVMELSGSEKGDSDLDLDDVGSDVEALEGELNNMRNDLAKRQEKKGKEKMTIGNMRFMKEAKERERQDALKLLNEMGNDEDGMDEYGSDGGGRDVGRVSFAGVPSGTNQNASNQVESEADSDEEERVRKEYENDVGGQGTGTNGLTGDMERIVRETADAPKGFATKLKGRISADVANDSAEKEVDVSEEELEKQVDGDANVNDAKDDVKEKSTASAKAKKSRPARNKRKRRSGARSTELSNDDTDNSPIQKTTTAPSEAKKARKVRFNDDAEKRQINDVPKASGLDADRARMELVARAFAGLGGADEMDFAASKAAQVEAEIDAETRTDAQAAKVLPGWGSWDGAGVKRGRRKRSAFAEAAAQKLAEARARAVEARKDKNHTTLQLATSRPAAARALTLGSVPFPFRTAVEWQRELDTAAVQELAPRRAFQARIQPSVTTRKGAAIEPIQFDGRRASEPDEKVQLRGKGKITKSKGKRAVLERRKKTAKARESKRRALHS